MLMVIDGVSIGYKVIVDCIQFFFQSENVDCFFYCYGFVLYFDKNKDKICVLSVVVIVDGRIVDYMFLLYKIFDFFQKVMLVCRRYFLVGISMGGFFVAWLGVEFGLLYVVINLVVNLLQMFWKYIGEGVIYYGSCFVLKEEMVEVYSIFFFCMDG